VASDFAILRPDSRGLDCHPGQQAAYVGLAHSRHSGERIQSAHEPLDEYDADFYRDLVLRAGESVVAPPGWDRVRIRQYLRGTATRTLESVDRPGSTPLSDADCAASTESRPVVPTLYLSPGPLTPAADPQIGVFSGGVRPEPGKPLVAATRPLSVAGGSTGTLQQDPTPVEAVLIREDGERTGLLEGVARFRDRAIRFDLDDLRVNCRYTALQRVAVDAVPPGLSGHFTDGLSLQWIRDGTRWKAVVAVRSDSDGLARFAARVCAAVLDDAGVHVEQTATPNRVETGTDPETRIADTTITVDPETGTVAFGTADVRSVEPAHVTVFGHVTAKDGGTDDGAVRVRTLASEWTVESRIVPSSEREAAIVRDHVANATTLSAAGGPIRVLFVDDEPGLVELAKLHLGDHDDLSIEFATTTPGALDSLEDGAYECVVTDYAMPEGGAPAILEAARELDPQPCFVVLSRQDPEALPDDQVPVGFDVWATKEVGADQYHRLAGTIRRLVGLRRDGE
jgi:CheY-like chemotaxis protein